jgi:hypothetical protein
MNGGTMNIVGDALHGDPLQLNGGQTMPTYTLNLSGNVGSAGTPETIGDTGTGYGVATINLAAGSDWTGSAPGGPYGGGSVIQGAGTWTNTDTSANNVVVVDVTLDPKTSGTFTAIGDHNQAPRLEFMKPVPASQSVLVEGGGYGNEHGNLQIDDPASFQAPVTLGFGEIILKGLTASSYSYANDMLSVFNGKSVVDTLKLAMQTSNPGGQLPTNFGVSQVGGSVIIHTDGSAYNEGGALLPMHT